MSDHKKILFLFITSFLVLIFSYYIPKLTTFVCDSLDCRYLLSGSFHAPVFYASVSVFFTSFLLLINSKVFQIWKKFALLYLIIYVVSVYLAPIQGRTEILPFTYLEKSTVSIFLSVLFVAISLLIILISAFRSRTR